MSDFENKNNRDQRPAGRSGAGRPRFNHTPFKSWKGEGETAGVLPRDLAVAVLHRVLRHKQGLEEALPFELGQRHFAHISAADESLARAIISVSLKHYIMLERAVLARLSSQLPGDSGLLLYRLIVAAAQILFLDIPDRAAVHIGVEQVKTQARTKPYAALANAVLRKLAAEKEQILAAHQPLLGVPTWLRDQWIADYGEDIAIKIATASGSAPSIDLTPLKITPEALQEATNGVLLPNGSVRLQDQRAVQKLTGFEEGHFIVQDVAAALPVALLQLKEGMKVLDLCAAPGGKTIQMAANGAKVVAVDRSAQRLKRLHENLARTQYSAEIYVADALEFRALNTNARGFDAVLLDAPCSATGTLRRHPDIAYVKGLSDIEKLIALQEKLLAHAATLVKPGGQILYVTCSLQKSEGEAQIARFLAANPQFSVKKLLPADCFGLTEFCTEEGYMRALPHYLSEFGGCDGFFAGLLVRKPD